MKYWFFDGNDVTGPFSLKELMRNKSFSEGSLVCPENFSDDGDHWQLAVTFDDFKPFFARNAQPDEQTTTFEQEMDTLLKETSPLAFDETPSEGPGLQIPKKPAKPGPIEEYFNQVKEEDLGDILGIPNPNENSDMDLAHALEKQLAKTSSTRRREREQEQENETDTQTAAELKQANQTHHVATATEVFATRAPVTAPATTAPTQSTPDPELLKKDTPSMPVVESPTMPVVETPIPSTTKAQEQPEDPEPKELVTQPASQMPEELAQEPVSTTDEKPQPAPEIVPDPAQLRREKVEVNSIRAGLKQTQEMKDFLHETANSRLKKEIRSQKRLVVMLLTVLVIIGGLLFVFQLRPPTTQGAPTPPQNPQDTVQELLTEPADVPPGPTVPVQTTVRAPQPAINAQTTTQEQKALAIVQHHPLSGQRGTLASYLNRIYKNQLAQGYSGTWDVEPLYKNTYIVKYRLTKTRKEPIIYVFQADVAQGKLTSALNNISLDLIGKL